MGRALIAARKVGKITLGIGLGAALWIGFVAAFNATLTVGQHDHPATRVVPSASPVATPRHADPIMSAAALEVTCDSADPTTVEIDGRTLSAPCPSAGRYFMIVDESGTWSLSRVR